MSRIGLFVTCLLFPVLVSGQDVVKVNILDLAGKIPPPPADVKEAFQRSDCKEAPSAGYGYECHPERFYKPVVDRLDATRQDIEKAVMTLSQPSMEAMKGMDAKEMRKKMKSMSKEDKMKMAMEMSKGAAPRAISPEPGDVMAAQRECQAVAGGAAEDIRGAEEIYQRRGKLVQARDRKHEEIDAWKEAEAKKLPQISTGETGGPEPKAYHALLVKATDRHLAAENEYLKAIAKEWQGTHDRYMSRYAPLQKKLVAIGHGEAAKNPETRRQILNAQGLMVGGTDDLVKLSREATDHAYTWWARKLQLEKEKP